MIKQSFVFKNKIVRKAAVLFSGVAVAAIFATGCTKKSELDHGLELKSTIRVNLTSEPPSLDWSVATDSASSHITTNIMQGLTQYEFVDGNVKIAPALAESWTVTPDQKKWTFVLRKDVKWTDGVLMTGQHFLDGWERLLNPKTGAEYASFLFNVKNAEKYYKGEIKDFNQVGVKVNPEGNLVVDLEKPQSFFATILQHQSTYPLRKEVVEKHGDRWTRPENIVTLGTFKLKVWEHDKILILERNEEFYGPKAKTKNLLFRMINEQSTALNLFKKGELDVIIEIPSIEFESISKMPEYKVMPIMSAYFYGFNVKMPPMDNVKVRKAFVHAVDRAEVIKILGAERIPAYNLLPQGMPGYDPSIGIRYDPVLAKKLLAEAYPDVSKMPKITIGFNTNDNHSRIAENVQAQLKRNLGIEVELKNEEWKTYLKALQAKNYMVYRLGWGADYPDPDTFINLFQADGGNNHTLWGNKRYDELMRNAVAEGDQAKRSKMYQEALKIINEDEVPMFPIYWSVVQHLHSKRVRNIPFNVMDEHDYTNAEIVE
jgi:oligopeptide transport system substrate-binding protein